jgi:hypothetical protein
MRVCQFRHDGNSGLQCSGGPEAAVSEDLHPYSHSHVALCQTARLIKLRGQISQHRAHNLGVGKGQWKSCGPPVKRSMAKRPDHARDQSLCWVPHSNVAFFATLEWGF